MQISDEALEELINIYEREFNKELSRSEVLEMAIRLTTLYEIILKPLPPEIEDEIRRRAAARPPDETALQAV